MIHENRQLGMRRARIDRFVAPVTQFIQTEAAGGIALLIAAIVALVWANSPWDAEYHRLLDHHLAFDLGFWQLNEPLYFWINDALMVLFFFVMGMEIKREIVIGELATLRKLVVPAAAATGGMIAPVLVFFVIVGTGEGSDGWGIPVATDIAFALGVLALLGPRIPAGLKVLLLALAIVDDIGGILVIAVFYTETIDGTALSLAVGTLLAAYVLRDIGIWYLPAYVALGIVGWAATVQSGIHPTIIGVAFGLLTPWRAWYERRGIPDLVEQLLVRFREGRQMDDEESISRQNEALLELGELASKSVSPLDRLAHMLLPITAFPGRADLLIRERRRVAVRRLAERRIQLFRGAGRDLRPRARQTDRHHDRRLARCALRRTAPDRRALVVTGRHGLHRRHRIHRVAPDRRPVVRRPRGRPAPRRREDRHSRRLDPRRRAGLPHSAIR